MIFTILIFIAILGLLVFVHELGHFLVAKRAGMKVDEFGFGFPPRLVGVYKSTTGRKIIFGHMTPTDPLSTIYSINSIPLGGFVKIVGENGDVPNDPNSFSQKSFWARLITLLAGVLMNVVLAWVLISIGFATGVPTVTDEQTQLSRGATITAPVITILGVNAESPADKAGLRTADALLAIDGSTFIAIEDVQNYVRAHKGDTLNFKIKRGKTILAVAVQSSANPKEGSGPTGIALGLVGLLKYPWYVAPAVAFKATGTQLWAVVSGIGHLVTGGVHLNQLGGPAKIAQLTGEASKLGFSYLLQFAAFLSLNLAVLNVLPIPALDGGRVLFLIIEKVRRRPNNQSLEQTVNAIGFLLLLILMLLVTAHDIYGFLGH